VNVTYPKAIKTNSIPISDRRVIDYLTMAITRNDYLKMTSYKVSCHDQSIDCLREMLERVFKATNIKDEAVEFWFQRTIGRMDWAGFGEVHMNFLARALDAKDDPAFAIEKRKSVVLNSRGDDSYSALFHLRRASTRLSNTKALLDVCKTRVKRNPADAEAVGILADAIKDIWDVDTQVAFWKGVIRDRGHESHAAILELESAFELNADEDEAITFWMETVRRFPESPHSLEVLDRILTTYGRDKAGLTFWQQMQRIHADNSDCGLFLANAYERCGQVTTAIALRKSWLDRFLKSFDTAPWRADTSEGSVAFDVERLIETLEESMIWNESFESQITFWETSLTTTQYSWFNRRIGYLCIARAILAYVEEDEEHRLDILKKGARMCPNSDEVTHALTAAFQKANDEEGLLTFWITPHLYDEAPRFRDFRLAEYYLSKGRYQDATN